MAVDPTWERDELILALDLYFKHRLGIIPSASHWEVIELSQFLNSLLLVPLHRRTEQFRNPHGVSMKLQNFRWVDPDIPGGLPRVSQRDRDLWAEFAGNPSFLSQLATAIRLNASDVESTGLTASELLDEEVIEGKVLFRLHRSRERSASIVKKRKDQAKAIHGRLFCEVCGFDFQERYGKLGDGFIECHHTLPLSKLAPGQTTKPSDLALLCANCHRMIHRSEYVSTVEELRAVLCSHH